MPVTKTFKVSFDWSNQIPQNALLMAPLTDFPKENTNFTSMNWVTFLKTVIGW